MQQTQPTQYPDFHFLLISPNLGAEWLFDAARAYWNRYRPTILTDLTFIQLLPAETRIIVTVIALRDTAAQIGVELARTNPTAYYDPVVYDLFEETKAALNARVETGEPFGVALVMPTPTHDPNAPIIPTPRLQPTRPPAGFVTEVPPATPAPPTTDPNASEPAPLSPTPGSVIG